MGRSGSRICVLPLTPWPAPPAKAFDLNHCCSSCHYLTAEMTRTLHVFFDRCHKLSIKSCCRVSRQKGSSRVYTLTEDTPIPKQTLALNVTANKEQVIQVIVDRMSALQPSPDERIIVTGPDLRPFHIGVGSLDTAIVHEEADVLMAFHMIEEAKTGQPAIKVVSDDTDVLVTLAPPSEQTGCIKMLSSPRSHILQVSLWSTSMKSSKHTGTSCLTSFCLCTYWMCYGFFTICSEKAAVFQWFDEAYSCVSTEERDHRFSCSIHCNDVQLTMNKEQTWARWVQTFSKERLLECDLLHPNSEVYHHDNLCTYTKLSLTCTTFCKCQGSFQCKNPRTFSITEAKMILADDAVQVWVGLQPSAFKCAISCSDTLPVYTRMFIHFGQGCLQTEFHYLFYNMIFPFWLLHNLSSSFLTPVILGEQP